MFRHLSTRILFIAMMVLLVWRPDLQAEDAVTFESQSDQITIKIRGDEFTVFHYGADQPKPYFWPLRAADGAILTRPIIPNERDHPHHKGVWLSVDEVNDIKFWVEQGQIRTRDIQVDSGNPVTIQLTNDWLANKVTPVLIERTKISIYANRLIVYDITLTPPEGKQTRFDDTKEGFFGIRVAQSMREKEGGVVVNSEGATTTQECWGRPAKWIDYSGNVDGKIHGVTLMDHPDNFRPSRYHVRDYGLFSLSPFGEGAYQNDIDKAKPVTIGEVIPSLRIRYGLYVHDGNATEGHVADAFERFLSATK